jgi:hypothetical protein
MAKLKYAGYDSWEITDVPEELAAELGDQVKLSGKELARAMNEELVTNRVFERVLANRIDALTRLTRTTEPVGEAAGSGERG